MLNDRPFTTKIVESSRNYFLKSSPTVYSRHNSSRPSRLFLSTVGWPHVQPVLVPQIWCHQRFPELLQTVNLHGSFRPLSNSSKSSTITDSSTSNNNRNSQVSLYFSSLSTALMNPTASSGHETASLYKSGLPLTAISFSSPKGKTIFKEALQNGTMETFFPLAEQFRTQDEPAYCALTTLTMVLNALQIDPYKTWKGPWRWFHETMLDCCVRLDVIKTEGMTFGQFVCLALCNGCSFDLTQRVDGKCPPVSRKLEFETLNKDPIEPTSASNHTDQSSSDSNETLDENNYLQHHIDTFRSVVEKVSSTPNSERFLVVSYDRSTLNQTGTGHFSPIAGYNKARDLVLIMDVARFKYPPHWIKVKDLVRAMAAIDPTTGSPRGYCVIRKSLEPDEGHLTLFQVELPRRAEARNVFSRFFEMVGKEINETAQLSNENQLISPLECLGEVFRSFIRALGNSPSMQAMLATARTTSSLWVGPRTRQHGDTVEINDTKLDKYSPIEEFKFDALQQDNNSHKSVIEMMIHQLESKPWYSKLSQIFKEEGSNNSLKKYEIEGGETLHGYSSSVTIEHLFISFFLSFLPQYKHLLTAPAWSSISAAINDMRLLENKVVNNIPRCVQSNEGSCKCPSSHVDVVYALLRLREILQKVQSYCKHLG